MHFGWIDLRIFRLLEVRPGDLFAVLVGRLMSSISWKVKKSVEIFFLTRLTRFLSVNAWPMELGSCNAKEKGFSNRV